jgi:hypothetical protein
MGNILYNTEIGRDIPNYNIHDFKWNSVNTGNGLEFWMLVLTPFFLSPIAFLVRRLARPIANWSESFIPELPPLIYIILIVIFYSYVVYSLVEAHAFSLFLSGSEANEAVQNRFALLAALGFKPQMVLKSLLVFLSVYGIVRAVRDGGYFWHAVSIFNVCFLTICLISLNMKWPAVIFILTSGLAVFVMSDKHPLVKFGLITVFGVATYFFLSVIILRWFPAEEPKHVEIDSPNAIVHTNPSSPSQSPAVNSSVIVNGSLFEEAIRGVQKSAPKLIITAINRMAIAVPYYYHFSDLSGPYCRPDLSRLWISRSIDCEPTTLVYTNIFGDDGFKGRGTAPAAVNIYGYALASWPGAIISTAAAMFVFGLFLALWPPLKGNAVFAAAYIMGGYTAYFFSQLPLEGPIIYDHGMLWWTILVLLWAAAAWPFRMWSKSQSNRAG